MTATILATPIALRAPRIADMLHERLSWKGMATNPGSTFREPGSRIVFYHQPGDIACWFHVTDHGNGVTVTIIGAADTEGNAPRISERFDTRLSDLQIVHAAITQFAEAEAQADTHLLQEAS